MSATQTLAQFIADTRYDNLPPPVVDAAKIAILDGFANMVAGHVLLAVLASFIVVAYQAFGWIGGAGVGFVVVLASIAFNLLELFVAFLQAFIFTFLTTLFIGQAIVFHHNGHEEGAH